MFLDKVRGVVAVEGAVGKGGGAGVFFGRVWEGRVVWELHWGCKLGIWWVEREEGDIPFRRDGIR